MSHAGKRDGFPPGARAGCQAQKGSLDLGIATPVTLRTSPCSCIYMDAHSFSQPWFAGIPRYTVQLSLALAAHVPVRFFSEGQELLPPRHLSWSQDQDLEHWGRRIWRGRRLPLSTPPADCIGLYCSVRPSHRIFPYEVSILHDFCPSVVPWAFPDAARNACVKFLTVAGNNSSQIEVVGDAGLLVNVANAGELAAQLVRVLDDSGRSRELRERAVVQARRFRWEETADKALEVLTRQHAPEPTVHVRLSALMRPAAPDRLLLALASIRAGCLSSMKGEECRKQPAKECPEASPRGWPA